MNAARKFLEDLIGLFGAPKRVITDQGTSYTGRVFESLCKDSKIKHIKNSTATPRGNGQVERLNRTLTPMIASLCKREDEKDWDLRIYQIQWSLNNIAHKVTKRTPFSLLMNYHSINPTGDPVTEEIRETLDEEICKQRQEALKRIRDDQEKQRKRYNAKRANAPSYEPGDMVVVQREAPATGLPRKTAPKYRGPYVITKKLGYDRYQIEDLPEAQRTQRFYRNAAPADKLKRFEIVAENSESESDNSFDTEDETQNENPDPVANNEIRQIVPVAVDEIQIPDPLVVAKIPDPISVDESQNPAADEEPKSQNRPRRHRKQPAHLKDYVI